LERFNEQNKDNHMTSYNLLKTKHLGDLLLTADEKQLTGIYFQDCRHAPGPRADWKLDARHLVLKQAGAELQEYLGGQRKDFSVPLRFKGTDFQNEVWRQISRIPFGQTITYSELARRAGNPDAVRAAGTATGRNPLSIIIPCHRVIGKDRTMHGYAGGLKRKVHLLELEARPTPSKTSTPPENLPAAAR
jgi:methylated-DNA-[protein]-cysteine S-methyltransferase